MLAVRQIRSEGAMLSASGELGHCVMYGMGGPTESNEWEGCVWGGGGGDVSLKCGGGGGVGNFKPA